MNHFQEITIYGLMTGRQRTLAMGLCLLTAGVAMLGLSGCSDTSTKRTQKDTAKPTEMSERREAIREAFRYLPQLIRLDRAAALREIRYQLNTWSKSVTESTDWKSAGLLDSVSASLRTIDFSKRMTKLEFGEPECEFLLQSQMMQGVSKWVLERPYSDPTFKPWLEEQKDKLSSEDWNRLETVLKLFDWTICNVAIEGQPKDAERLVTNSELPINDSAPTYRQLPWQTMTFARGDTWQRARVFSQLAFVQGIDTVVLALPSLTGASENASLRLWCMAVPIGKELYLLEPQWGLPIPSQTSSGIATLREAKENPTVLRRAKLPGRFEYPVEQADLKTLFALIDAEPFTVGRTMHTLENSLTGDSRVRLSIDADAIEENILKTDPTLSVRLWNVPWLAHVYNESMRERLNEKSTFSLNYVESFGLFITDTPISRARNLHFKGEFESSVDAAGALKTYMDVRIDEQTLKDLEYDRDTQMMLGVVKQVSETPESFLFRVQQAQAYYRRSKYDVAIFLAMANHDIGKLDTSNDWLSRRLLSMPGTERWHAHAHFLLGRNYEQQGNFQAAIKEYEYENSPQAAGNRIRIRRLQATTTTEK